MAAEPPPEQGNKRLFEEIDAYPFDSDAEFQVSMWSFFGNSHQLIQS
jgi:hypothetical protein